MLGAMENCCLHDACRTCQVMLEDNVYSVIYIEVKEDEGSACSMI